MRKIGTLHRIAAPRWEETRAERLHRLQSLPYALTYAAEHGDVSDVKDLLEIHSEYCQKETRRVGGRAPRSPAAEEAYLRVVMEQLRHGVAGSRHKQENLAVSLALWGGHVVVLAELIRHGAAIDSDDGSGRTTLSYAASTGCIVVLEELLKKGACVDSKDNKGRTALSYAAESGNMAVVLKLLHHGAAVDSRDDNGDTPLFTAAWFGHVDVVAGLIKRGADVDARNTHRRTSLSYAAQNGRVELVAQLILDGAIIEAKDSDGRTALSWAAEHDRIEVVTELVKSGAAVDTKSNDGRAPLSYAVERGHVDMVTELIKNGAAVDSKDNTGKPALSTAAEFGQVGALEELVAKGAAIDSKDHDGNTPLLIATRFQQFNAAIKLLYCGAEVDARNNLGRTPLFYAADWVESDMAQVLLNNGASATEKLCSGSSRRESETPLTIAGRAGHMTAFHGLIRARAPVNVRSAVDGETPLVSAARWDYFAGVRLLLEHRGSCRYEDVAEDEFPLIPGTLKTMNTQCAATFELAPICSRVLDRLWRVCSHVQDGDEIQVQRFRDGFLVSFTNIVFRFCRLLLQIGKRRNPLSRYIGSRALTSRIKAFHEEMDHFVGMLGLVKNSKSWKDQWGEDQSRLQTRFEELLSTDEALLDGCGDEQDCIETTVLLQHEIKTRGREANSESQEGATLVLERFIHACEIQAPVVPEWFISRDDLEFHSWNLVGSRRGFRSDRYGMHAKFYEGKWRNTNVMIETSSLSVPQFCKAASQWFHQSHPHVVNLFGACHIGAPLLFVYELVPERRQLHHFLSEESNRVWAWRCLYEAALGLQYLHNRNVVHGSLRGESIVVGSDLVTKLCGVCGTHCPFFNAGRLDVYWMAPEIFVLNPTLSLASDIYAFGGCIWEAVARESPSEQNHTSTYTFSGIISGFTPMRPANMTTPQWDLVRKMRTPCASKRVNIAYVVNELKHFVLKSAQDSKRTQIQQQCVNEHAFAELEGAVIPQLLRSIQLRCKALPDNEWMRTNVCPALEYMFALLQERHMAPADAEVVAFCGVLSRFQRYLRIAVSEKSVALLTRSRDVAETHYVVYSDLDRMLDLLHVLETDPIRVWRRDTECQQVPGIKGSVSTSYLRHANQSSSAVSLHHFDDAAPATHSRWTRAGLLTHSPTQLPWYFALRDLMFSKSDKIGQGAFGAVYKGSWLDTPVVVKFMGYEEDFDTISTDLLLHEVRMWHGLNHPHVLKLYGACHVDKRYFVCEYASNGDLTDYLKRSKGDNSKHLMWQKMYEAALGLEYLHTQNVAHNDLKCDNIMVGVGGKAKLIDFGLSCLLNEAEIQIDAKKMGAVHWKSPEYLAGGRPSFASDVYSLAMCIIEVVSGDVPWGKAMLAPVVRYRVKKGEIPILPGSMNEKQRNLIQLMTKFEPSERVKMGFVVDKLDEIVQDEMSVQAP